MQSNELLQGMQFVRLMLSQTNLGHRSSTPHRICLTRIGISRMRFARHGRGLLDVHKFWEVQPWPPNSSVR